MQKFKQIPRFIIFSNDFEMTNDQYGHSKFFVAFLHHKILLSLFLSCEISSMLYYQKSLFCNLVLTN